MNSTKKQNFYHQNWRWFVLGTLFLATFLNYFDRQTLGTAIDPIAKEFGLDNMQIGNLLSAFLVTYAWMHLFIGMMTDRIKNLRWFFPFMVIGWSISTMLVGLVDNYEHLIWLRYLLGIWEAVNFPICIMIISRIFPLEERNLALGIFASGAFLATLAAPPVVIYFSNEYNWRLAFIVAGSIGFLWLIPWLLIFRKPEDKVANWHDYNKVVQGKSFKFQVNNILNGYLSILKAPAFWGVALIGVGIVPSLYFATQWFPRFFTHVLKVPYDQTLSLRLSAIYFMQDVGLWLAGVVVLFLAYKKVAILKSRKTVIVFAWLLMISVIIVPQLKTVEWSVFFLCLYVFGIGAFLGNQHAFKQDIIKDKVATVAALVGFIEMNFTSQVIKQIGVMTNDSGDFSQVFFMMAGLATFALVVVFVFMRKKWLIIE
ncbi:MFS transporter [Mariniflexile sp. HMF6888]|uniref:MFS transporter n=1 Tax=Mariniflexile sp. HMF6888 TaxID=3373086 RepID=UPI003789E507